MVGHFMCAYEIMQRAIEEYGEERVNEILFDCGRERKILLTQDEFNKIRRELYA